MRSGVEKGSDYRAAVKPKLCGLRQCAGVGVSFFRTLKYYLNVEFYLSYQGSISSEIRQIVVD